MKQERYTIQVRVSAKLKEAMEAEAEKYDESVSEMLREMFKTVIYGPKTYARTETE